ncbi:MAG: metallopeptidase TldD-related protein [Candidatus Sericytochromatia bacterium]|nr:metallopeptidase TldD-related protein [Candidatus Sericytochromatia bacterium]
MITALPFDAEVRHLLGLAEFKGLTDVEVYARRDEALTLRANQGTLESFQRSHSVGLGVRVVEGDRVGYAYSENLTPEALDRMLSEAAENAAIVAGEAGVGLVMAAEDAPAVPGLYEPSLEDVALEAKVTGILRAEAAARADARVKAVPGCVYADATSVVRVASTRGLDRHFRSNQAYAVVFPLVSEAGENRTGIHMHLTRRFETIDFEAVGRQAVGHACRRLGARSLTSGQYPVVFTPRAMSELLSAFSDVFSAKAAQEGKSLLAGRLGEAVAATRLTLLDDALLAEGYASRPFDDEGTASRTCALIEGGVFKTFLHNAQTARQMGVASTGHASRGGYKGTLSVAPTNLYVQPGDQPFAALVAGPGPVVVIDDLQGVHAGTNAISGDFSLQCQGWLYLDGVEQHAVANITVAGNFVTMLAGVEALGDDLEFHPHGAYIGSPSVRIAELAIAGA